MPKKAPAAAAKPAASAATVAAVEKAAAAKTSVPKKPSLADRLTVIEEALAGGFNVSLETYDPAKIREVRAKALADASEKAAKIVSDAVAEANSVTLTDAERLARIEAAIAASLGVNI